MFITVINDCRDSNAVGRQSTRIASLFGIVPTFVGVGTDLEAAGNLIDILDAGEGKEGVIMINVAPRNGAAKKWQNGTPFGHFTWRKTLVVASIDGLTLSLVKELRLTDSVRVLDIPEVLRTLSEQGKVADEEHRRIASTQFRSFEFLPKAAKWLVESERLPDSQVPIAEFPDAFPAVWFVDNFGNCKTTILDRGQDEKHGPAISLGGELIPRYQNLKDVPDGSPALITGSSGQGRKRFLELVVQGGSAAERFRLRSGDRINYFSSLVVPDRTRYTA